MSVWIIQITATDDSQHDEEKNYGDVCSTDKPHILKQKEDSNWEQLGGTYVKTDDPNADATATEVETEVKTFLDISK